MKNLKRSRLYRVGSAFLAAAMVFTCVPQTGFHVYAEESEPAEQTEMQTDGTSNDFSDMPILSDTGDNSPKDGDVRTEEKTGDEETDQDDPGENNPGKDDPEDEEKTESDGDDDATDDFGEEDDVEPEDGESGEVSGNDLEDTVVVDPNEALPEEETSELSVFQVNPLYEGVLDVEELRREIEQIQKETSSHVSLYALERTAERFESTDEAGEYMHGQMLSRVNPVSFVLPTSMIPSTESEQKALFNEIVQKAAIYTPECSGQEGDALALGSVGWKVNLSSQAGNTDVTWTFDYVSTLDQEKELTKEVDEVVMPSLNLEEKSEYQKIRTIYDYICDHVDYDYTYKKHSAYDALCTGTAVCQGYSILFYRLCKEAGLSVRCITGDGYGGTKWEKHAWNIVRFGDRYYNMDSTWDGQGNETTHHYFMLNEKDFTKHLREGVFATEAFYKEYPMAEDTYIDKSEFDGKESLKADNFDYTFLAIDGKTLSTAANEKPKLLIFFTPVDGNSQSTIKSIADSGLTGCDIYAVAISAKDSSASQNDVLKFKNNYGGDSLAFAYDDGGNNNKLWDYIEKTGEENPIFPMLCYIDANNKFQYYTQGATNATWVKANLQHYCNAVFGAADEYTITYVLNGGTNNPANPSTYQAEDLPLTLHDPDRAGYLFQGWYTDAAFTEENKVTSIAFGAPRDITLYAKWEAEPVEYEVKPPTRTVYLTDEDETDLDLTGAEIQDKATHSKVADITSDMVGTFSSDTEGPTKVSVTYDGQNLSFDVLVVKVPTGLTMELGQSLKDVTLPTPSYGTWQWKDGESKPTTAGTYTASLRFTAKDSVKFGIREDIETQITVKDQAATAYGIESPEKNVYLTGETLDLKGAQIIEKSTGTKVKDIEAVDLNETDLVLGNAGVSTFSVTYLGETLSFDVLVVKAPTGLTMELGQSLANVTLPTSSYGTWQWNNSAEKPDAEGKKGYKLTFTPSDTSKFTERTDISVEVEVTRKKVEVSGVTVSDKTYNGVAFSYTGTPVLRAVSGSIISGNVNLQASYTGTGADGSSYDSAAAPGNAGRYTLSFSLAGADADQYVLTGTYSYDFEIRQKEVRIAVNPRTIGLEDTVPTPTYTVIGLVSGDELTKEPTFSYNPTLPNPLEAGRYSVVPSGADAGSNYEIKYAPGTLEVTGDEPAEDTRELFSVEFDTIQVKDKTYDGKKHRISGYPSWSKKELTLDCVCQVKGTARDGEPYDASKSVKIPYNSVPTEFAKVYEEIAPVKCGSYTFEIIVLVDETKYNYTGSGFRQSFYVLPLKEEELKLSGVTGITDKIYDGTPVDFSKQILAARVQTNQGANIEGAALEYGIKGTTAGSETENYDVTISPSNPQNGMPTAAGSYTLWVRLIGTDNYAESIWKFPFEIGRKALTVKVEDKQIPVHADGSQLGGYTYVITDAEGKVLSNDDFGKPLIEPLEEVDSTRSGEYELAASGDIAGPNYDITFVNGKLFIQAQLWGVREPKLTQNTNIPNGLSLEEIAGKYLPKTVTIYLDEEKRLTDTAAVEWDTKKPYAGSYSEKNTSAQTFKMKGTVVLPDQVYVEDSHKDWLTVVVDVSVREAYEGQAMKPYADVQTGTVSEGTKVSLFTEEPDSGAQIYYTVEADAPSVSVNRKLYTGPIEIKCTVTIRAITRVNGKKDSEELRLVYYFDRNHKPNGDDDPDDPDNPSVPDEDVPKDENGKPLPIPEGLWVTDITGYTYTGKAIKPAVRVYDHKKRLEEKKDYTISYKNNVNAADKSSAKAPTITIKGKGNYEGTLLQTFTISPKNINDSDVKADDLTVAFNNKPQTPAPAVIWNGKKLNNKKDYSFDANPQTNVGTYAITLNGSGNYTGVRKVSFTISNATPAAKLSVSRLPAFTYTGNAIEPEPVVKSGREVLKNRTDYTLSYEDNIEVGTASLLVTGKGRFAGVKRVNFQIKEAAVLNRAKAELKFEAPTIYTGKEITASDYNVTVQATVNGVKQDRILIENTDYKVTYQNNVKAGKATVVFEGINAYRGTLKKTFTISPYELDLDRSKLLRIQSDETYPYMKGGSTPKPVITFDGKKLQEGTDYTVSYKNNAAAGSPAVMTIKGKGNFKGSVARGFNVAVQDIARMSVEPVDKVFQAKANIYKTTIRVYDTNGKQLSAGRDYDKNVIYTYASATTLLNSVKRKADEAVANTDIIPAGTKIKVTLNAAGANYQGTAVGEYTIVQSDISKAKVTVPTQIYTGKAIEPKEKDITVIVNGVAVPPEGYKITGYSNNVNKGTAKLTIRGQGNNYGGTKTVSFKIKSKSLLGQIFGS